MFLISETMFFISNNLSIDSTIRYWRRKHFKFAADNGFSKFLADGLRNSENTKYQQMCIDSIPDHDSWTKRRDPEGEHGLRAYLFRSLRRYTNAHGMHAFCKSEGKYASLQAAGYMQAPSDAKCGWPPCKKWKGIYLFATKQVCAGCRLVRYWCREHQKRHWKYMHREQCLKSQ